MLNFLLVLIMLRSKVVHSIYPCTTPYLAPVEAGLWSGVA
jgi:hypothetical protein